MRGEHVISPNETASFWLTHIRPANDAITRPPYDLSPGQGEGEGGSGV
ncbi:MAG TPA: hypothetical protein VFK47_17855 [Ktedonobacteraceae bacterium]|nr:hypothetical protein [Ktedonobacteraceae bacterium]